MASRICVFLWVLSLILGILSFLIAPVFEIPYLEDLGDEIPLRYYLSFQIAAMVVLIGWIIYKAIRKPSSSGFSLSAFNIFMALAAVSLVGPVASCNPEIVNLSGRNSEKTDLLDLVVKFSDTATQSVWPTMVLIVAAIIFGLLYWLERFGKDEFRSWLFARK